MKTSKSETKQCLDDINESNSMCNEDKMEAIISSYKSSTEDVGEIETVENCTCNQYMFSESETGRPLPENVTDMYHEGTNSEWYLMLYSIYSFSFDLIQSNFAIGSPL